jgi:hypothetical protein
MFASSLEIAEKTLIEAGLKPRTSTRKVWRLLEQYDEKLIITSTSFLSR